MSSAVSPLRHRDFALLWSAALVSNIGTWMQIVAVGILVTARTGRAGWTGLVAAAGFLPIGLLSPVGGVLADRLDRRRWLLITTLGETGSAATLAVLSAAGRPGPGPVTFVVLAGGAMAAVGFPAYQAMLPDLVPRHELGAAISLSSAQFNFGRVLGPVLAGFAIVVGGYPLAFAANALSFLAVVVVLRLIRLRSPPRPARAVSLARQLATGLAATARSPGARFAVGTISLVALTASPFIALIPAMALEVFGSKALGASVLVTAQGMGAVAGALAVTPLVRRFGRRRVLVGHLTGVCVFLTAYASAPDLWSAAAALLLVGASYIGVLAGCNTIVQLSAPPELRGRMLGMYMMALGILYPAGAILQGALADAAGLRLVTLVGAGCLLAMVALAVAGGWIPSALEARPDPLAPPEAGGRSGTVAV